MDHLTSTRFSPASQVDSPQGRFCLTAVATARQDGRTAQRCGQRCRPGGCEYVLLTTVTLLHKWEVRRLCAGPEAAAMASGPMLKPSNLNY